MPGKPARPTTLAWPAGDKACATAWRPGRLRAGESGPKCDIMAKSSAASACAKEGWREAKSQPAFRGGSANRQWEARQSRGSAIPDVWACWGSVDEFVSTRAGWAILEPRPITIAKCRLAWRGVACEMTCRREIQCNAAISIFTLPAACP